MKPLDKKNIRYNIMSLMIYAIGIIIIVKLFSLQIVNGEEYLEKSNSRLTRETTITASRGNILDCNNNILAGTKIKYSLELYKSKIETEQLNKTILNVINILEKNEDKYIDEFPITINPIQYTFSNDEKKENWLEAKKIDIDSTAEQTLKHYIEKYELTDYSIEDARKIIAVRYGIEQKRVYSNETIYNFRRYK